jgi:hypothetical protein
MGNPGFGGANYAVREERIFHLPFDVCHFSLQKTRFDKRPVNIGIFRRNEKC